RGAAGGGDDAITDVDPRGAQQIRRRLVGADLHSHVAEIVVVQDSGALEENRCFPGWTYFERLEGPAALQELPRFGEAPDPAVNLSDRERLLTRSPCTRDRRHNEQSNGRCSPYAWERGRP